MSEDDVCGSLNTTSGEPCQFSPGDSCPWHNTDNPPDNGRPSKLSYERQEKIATAIEQGKSLNSAARMAGVDPSTVYGWVDRGEAAIEAGKENEFADFYKRLTHAKGYGEDFYFGLALELARENGDHRFIASLMKQRYPDSWGDTETGVDADVVDVNISEEVASTWPE